MGKVIGGGLPVGAYGGKKEIMQMVAPAGPMYQARAARAARLGECALAECALARIRCGGALPGVVLGRAAV